MMQPHIWSVEGPSNVMITSLEDLRMVTETLGNQPNTDVGGVPAQYTTQEIQELDRVMRMHTKTQGEMLGGMKGIVQNVLKNQVSDRLKIEVSEHIRSEIVAQVRKEVDEQIIHFIPVSLEQQACNNKVKLKNIQINLENSEARIHNSSIKLTDQDDPLARILKKDGTVSALYPADLRSLHCYEDEVVKTLMGEYDLPRDDLFETNLKRFMEHIGIEG